MRRSQYTLFVPGPRRGDKLTCCSNDSFSCCCSSERGSALSILSCSSFCHSSGFSASRFIGTWTHTQRWTISHTRLYLTIYYILCTYMYVIHTKHTTPPCSSSSPLSLPYPISDGLPVGVNLLVQELKQTRRVELKVLHHRLFGRTRSLGGSVMWGGCGMWGGNDMKGKGRREMNYQYTNTPRCVREN